jgi:hypothetical protein
MSKKDLTLGSHKHQITLGVVLTGLYILLPIIIYFGLPVLCKTSNTLVLILYIISISGILAPFLFMIYFNLRQSAESKKYKLGK